MSLSKRDVECELCIIGAGTAGFAAASAAHDDGRDVRLVAPPGDLGGTCILRGCMPATTLLVSTHALGYVRDDEALGVEAARPHVDLRRVIERKRTLVEYFASDRREALAELPMIRAEARFLDPHVVQAGDVRIHAERTILATGARIEPPAIDGIAQTGYLTSDDVLEMTHAPARLAILGGGPVGCEFAQYFARLGTRVTLLQDGPALLRNEDADVAEAVAAALRADGVSIVFDAQAVRARPETGGKTLEYASDGRAATLHVDEIVVATGRIPNIASLDLERAEVRVEGGRPAVDAFLRTSNLAVYAAGDVLGRRALVHVAEYAGRLAARNAFAREPVAADFERYEAHAVYTQPEFATAGLTERECAERGFTVDVRRHPFSDIGKAVVSNEPDGFIKMLATPDGRIVGVTIVGANAIDLIGEGIALVDAGAHVRRVAGIPHLHPTMGEIYARVAEDFADGPDRSDVTVPPSPRRSESPRP